ncbi:MAG: putative sugar nucleotidyl transferase [Lacibacter sp.]
MNIVLFDTTARTTLYPFTAIRPVAEIRAGILTNRERWELLLQSNSYTLTEGYLQDKYPFVQADDFLLINAALIPSLELVQSVRNLALERGITQNGIVLAVRTANRLSFGFTADDCKNVSFAEWKNKEQLIQYPFELVRFSEKNSKADFDLITRNKSSQPVSSTNHVIDPEAIFIEEGAVVEHCFLNASAGPVYIGKDCLVMEGSMIRGPFAALEKSVVKLGSKIYGATTVGRQCTVGGEIKNSIFFDYSNKAHDGYIGDAVIGEWCNVGAGASCSNIKNTAGEVKIWNPHLHQWISAGNKCGVMLGDYTKVAINSSLTTGMVSGICSNIVTEGLSPKYIADFTWNIKTGEKYMFDKATRDIENWMYLKNKFITDADRKILQHIYNQKPKTTDHA